jgi:hypothetical protein
MNKESDIPTYYFELGTENEYIAFRTWLIKAHYDERVAVYINGSLIELDDQVQKLLFILGLQEGFRIAKEGKFTIDAQ